MTELIAWPSNIVTEGRIDTDEFCLKKRQTNEVFDGRLSLFDMFNILDILTNGKERQIIGCPPEGRQYPLVGDPLSPELTDEFT